MLPGEMPMVGSLLEVVPKRGTNKFRLTINMRSVKRHIGKQVFKFEGLKDLADLEQREDPAMSYDLMPGYSKERCFVNGRSVATNPDPTAAGYETRGRIIAIANYIISSCNCNIVALTELRNCSSFKSNQKRAKV